MTDLIVIAGIVGVVAALAVAPLFLPWPSKVEWILTAESVNPLIAAANGRHGVQVGPVTLVAVDNRPERLAISVQPGEGGPRALVGRPAAPGELAALEGWCHLGTMLLLVDDAHGAVLHGPDRAVTGLREADRATTT